jgi:hypothetical protein
MTREIENPLKQMFADLDENLPSAGFTSEVMSELLKPRQRERLLRSSAVLAALAFLWLSFPHLDAGVRIVGSASLATLSQSPLVYVYGMALGGYALLWLMRRIQIRFM